MNGWTRRAFVGAGVAVWAAKPAWAGEETHGILYGGWHDSMGGALDALESTVEALGPDVASKMEVVRDAAGRWGALARFERDGAATAALAAEHTALLSASSGADGTALAESIVLSAVDRVYNVSYGVGPNLDALVARHAEITRLLGPGVARSLVVEQRASGGFALVYKRYGDRSGTDVVALRHARLLAPHGLSATSIQERHQPVVYDGTTVRLPPAAPAPPPPAPAPPAPPSDAPVAVAVAAVAAPTPRTTPPIVPPVGSPAELGPGDTALEVEVEAWVKAQRERGRVSPSESTSWLVHDLEADTTLCAINADEPRQAASMVKPFVMLAFFHEAQRGRFVYGPESTGRFESMIQQSSNSSTNWAFAQIGGPAEVQRILTTAWPTLFRHTSIVETIADGGRTYRNKASASDYVRYLRALWRDELPYAAEQKRLLNLPGRDRLYSDAPNIPVGTSVYNKTGSTARLCGDMGVLVAARPAGPPFPYAIVGIVQRTASASNYGSWISTRADVIRGVSDLTYRWLKPQRGLV